MLFITSEIIFQSEAREQKHDTKKGTGSKNSPSSVGGFIGRLMWLIKHSITKSASSL